MELTFEQYKQEVVDLVTKEIGDKKWFRGVCVDGLQEMFPNIQEGVDLALMQTSYWDAGDDPDYGF